MNKFSLPTATTVAQSDRLVALGVKPETADCFISQITETDDWSDENTNCSLFEPWMNKENVLKSTVKPAWSLSRLIDMMPAHLQKHGINGRLFISRTEVSYAGFGKGRDLTVLFVCTEFYNENANVFDLTIIAIEHLIEIGKFDKEYLVNKLMLTNHE